MEYGAAGHIVNKTYLRNDLDITRTRINKHRRPVMWARANDF